MKNLLKIIFCVCGVFILLGFATIIKGDIENAKEGWIMIAYLSFFSLIMLFTKFAKFGKKTES